LLEGVVQALVGQLHDDDQLAVHLLDQLGGDDERVADLADAVQGALLLLGAGGVDVERVEVAEDELDGLEQPAGGLTLPDLAEAAAAQRLDQAVARQGFAVGLAQKAHGAILPVTRPEGRPRSRKLMNKCSWSEGWSPLACSCSARRHWRALSRCGEGYP